jgi:adenosylcobinamide-phosphate synthase
VGAYAGWSRAAGLALGVALDAAIGDPRRLHPVAGFGRVAGRLEQLLWADSRCRGAVFTTVCVGASTAVGAGLSRLAGASPIARTGVTALATWAVLGSKSLISEGLSVHRLLEAGDLAGAREQITHLVGRDPSELSADDIARAAVESVAENSSDAVVAPLFWGAIAGIPGLLGYRAVNTLDAMVGYRSRRYARFGWASARLDDLVNLAPSRATAVAVAAISRAPRRTWAATRRFARAHPSPNSGWCEAAYAAALGVRLGGTNSYGGRVEHRPRIGTGRAPVPSDIPAAARLTTSVILVTTIGAIAASQAVTSLVRRIRGGRDR